MRLRRVAGGWPSRRYLRPWVRVGSRRERAETERSPLVRAVLRAFVVFACFSVVIGAHLFQPVGQGEVGGSQFRRAGSNPGGARPAFTR